MKESIQTDERKTAEHRKKRPLPAGLPYLVTGAVLFILSLLLPECLVIKGPAPASKKARQEKVEK